MSLTRAPFIDEYVEGAESVVMLTDGRVVVISSVMTEVLRLVDAGVTSIDALEAAVVQTFGKSSSEGAPGNSGDQSQDIENIVRYAVTRGLLRS